jgi:hypothetical protein
VNAEKILKEVHDDIFCREWGAWYTDERTWLKDRSWRAFKQWFDIEHCDVSEDVGAGPFEDE